MTRPARVAYSSFDLSNFSTLVSRKSSRCSLMGLRSPEQKMSQVHQLSIYLICESKSLIISSYGNLQISIPRARTSSMAIG